MKAPSTIRRLLTSDTTILVLLALAGTLLHILLNGQYGFHRDELDIIMNARQLDWGYIAYPPFTPFIARIGLILFGNSLRGLRVFSALSQGIVMVLTGWMARDMGGKRSAQVTASIAATIAPVALTAGTLIQYMAFDFFWWVVIAFFFVRLLATENPRYWLGIGAGIGMGMMNKFTAAFWAAGLIAAVLLSQRRKDLLSKWLWMGAGLAVLIYLPNLIWQVQHHFISLDFLQTIHARDLLWGRGKNFLPEQITSSTNPLTLPIWAAGLLGCIFAGSLRRFRPLAWMFLTTFAIFLFSRGRSYYVAPAYVMLTAAGSCWWVNWLSGRATWLRRTGTSLLYGLIGAGAVLLIIIVKPVAPINSRLWETTSRLNPEVVEMIGWPDLVEQVQSVYLALPENEKAHTVILAANYGEAGALDLYSGEMDLPQIISGADNFWFRGYGSFEPETVIAVGMERGFAAQYFNSCIQAGSVTNRYGVRNEETSRHTGIYVCREARQPWAEMWTHMLWYQ